MSEIMKQKAREEYAKVGGTKSAIAVKYNVPPRTMSRWLEGVVVKPATSTQAVPPKGPAVKKSSFTAQSNANLTSSKTLAPSRGTMRTSTAPATKPAVVENDEYTVLATGLSISITKLLNGKVVGTAVVDKKNSLFNVVLTNLQTNAGFMNQDVLRNSYLLMLPREAIAVMSLGAVTIDADKNTIIYTDPETKVAAKFTSAHVLAKRMIDCLKGEGVTDKLKRMVKFLERLMLNPSNRSVQSLYSFLEHNDIEITDDGYFHAWKVVRSNYKDKHSGTFDNSVGQRPTVLRNQVDENIEQECSFGLHVCAKSYIKSFYSSGDKIVKVKVDPADAVAVPRDYNGAKMRCCGYLVLEDVTKVFYK